MLNRLCLCFIFCLTVCAHAAIVRQPVDLGHKTEYISLTQLFRVTLSQDLLKAIRSAHQGAWTGVQDEYLELKFRNNASISIDYIPTYTDLAQHRVVPLTADDHKASVRFLPDKSQLLKDTIEASMSLRLKIKGEKACRFEKQDKQLRYTCQLNYHKKDNDYVMVLVATPAKHAIIEYRMVTPKSALKSSQAKLRYLIGATQQIAALEPDK